MNPKDAMGSSAIMQKMELQIIPRKNHEGRILERTENEKVKTTEKCIKSACFAQSMLFTTSTMN